MPVKLVRHMRRWKAADKGLLYIVQYKGLKVTKIYKAWRGAVRDADLPPSVVPHLLRHTRGTWLAERSVPTGQAARITVQDLFLRYPHLAGMTGTAAVAHR